MVRRMTFFLTLALACLALFWLCRTRPGTLERTYENAQNNAAATRTVFTVGDAVYISNDLVTCCYAGGRTNVSALSPWLGQETEKHILCARREKAGEGSTIYVYSKERRERIFSLKDVHSWRICGEQLYYMPVAGGGALHRLSLETQEDTVIADGVESFLPAGEEYLYYELQAAPQSSGGQQTGCILALSGGVPRPGGAAVELCLPERTSPLFWDGGAFCYADGTGTPKVVRADPVSGARETVYEGPFDGLLNVFHGQLYIKRVEVQEETERKTVRFYRIDSRTGEEYSLGGFGFRNEYDRSSVSVLDEDICVLKTNGHALLYAAGEVISLC